MSKISREDSIGFSFHEDDDPSVSPGRRQRLVKTGHGSNSINSVVAMSEFELEIVRAEVTTIEFNQDKDKKWFSFCILAMLMGTQISSLWTKFIIGSAYNYDGVHNGEPRWDITAAIPFTYTQYSEITGIYYSLTYGLAALCAGMISDNFSRKSLLAFVGVCWNLTSYGNVFAQSFTTLALMRMAFGLFSAFSSPISYSLISDYFPPQNRTIANAFFTAASFFGIAFATLS